MGINSEAEKTELFERAAVPTAVMTMAVPTILSSLVMVLYNLADTYFVGMLNDPVQNSAVTLAALVLLAFDAVSSSSMMSRSLGKKDYDAVRRRPGHLPLQLRGLRILLPPSALQRGKKLCLHPPLYAESGSSDPVGDLRRRNPRRHPKSFECDGNDGVEQLHLYLRP